MVLIEVRRVGITEVARDGCEGRRVVRWSWREGMVDVAMMET